MGDRPKANLGVEMLGKIAVETALKDGLSLDERFIFVLKLVFTKNDSNAIIV